MMVKAGLNVDSTTPSMYFKLQKTKTLNCTNNLAYCTPDIYFIKKAYIIDTTSKT